MAEVDIELNRRGNRLLAQREYQGARAAFEQLIAQSPSNPDGFIGLAKVFERTGSFEEAIHRLGPVVDQLDSPTLLRAFADACRVLVNRGRSEYLSRAIAYYERYHARRSDPVSLFYAAELLAQSGSLDAAARLFRASWDLDPRSREAFRALIGCLEKLGRQTDVSAVRQLWQERNSQQQQRSKS